MAESNNPWSTQDKSLTGLKKALMLGERTGHVANKSKKSTHLPSVKLIQLNKTSRGSCPIGKLRMQDKETRDITHLDVLGMYECIDRIKSLNSHIECVIESKELLNRRLQQPFQGEYLKLEAQHHKLAHSNKQIPV
ncbi:hypothetical protein DPMN_034234 [Dreissena polymorpha]|uniref:Uncharacterized protein n=1 Tax=Dreissena polymorpha TaxID=45954 RepID=A0A9D4M5A7_DREPO|nr:hypothetical protein DPMN_034234 [Dreissena polymorpha]